ncbi:MAG: response regulator [Gammaproteobacteria bacterium]|nr:response regulator [Gammaproteobacteria bacterium]
MDSQDKKKVLVIDDVAANINIMGVALQDEYEMFAATSGEDGLTAAEEERPDLILLDIMMPKMDGYEVCQKLKADPNTREIPVIFVTAMIDEKDESKGFACGAIDYIAKPIRPPIVKARVKNHLNLKLAHKALAEKNEELAQKNEKLAQNNKKLEEMAVLRETVERITRHDIKTPLNGIIGFPQQMMQDSNLTGKQKDLLETVADSGRTILEMIDSSLELYKMEMGTYCYEPVMLDLLPLFHKVIRETDNLIGEKGVSAEIRVHGRPAAKKDSFAVEGEPRLCYSLFANLFKNAVEASPKQGRIAVSLEKKGEECFITVHNGGAVPEQIRVRFFEKYITAGKYRGTGLGTYSAKLIAETLGGGISLRTSEQAGTTITVRLRKADDEEYAMEIRDNQHKEKTSVPEPAAETKKSPAPPRALLDQLYDLSLRGDIIGIQNMTDEIEQAGEQYLPFTAEVRTLADEFQIKKVHDFIKIYLD